MKINSIPIIVMFLASAMILPVGMSYAQNSNVTATTPGIQTLSNKTNTNATATAPGIPTVSNQTNTNQASTSTNSTVSQSNDTKAAQQVFDFVHQAVADFKQQGIETRQTMLDCRDKLQAASPSDMDRIKQDCTLQLNTIKAKYQNERVQFHDLMKQYRDDVIVFLNDARGQQISKTVKDNSFAHLGMMMSSATHGKMMMPSTSHGKMMGKAAAMNNTR